MITIFNRKELFATFSMDQQVKIRDKLLANNIKYSVKCVNLYNQPLFGDDMHSRMGTFGENMNYEYEYTIFVHKNDYDKAKYVTGL